jgi:hypothetical protein
LTRLPADLPSFLAAHDRPHGVPADEHKDHANLPKLSRIGLLEFFRAEEAIAEGRKCVPPALPEIEYLLQRL